MKILICDDEKLYIEQIKQSVKKFYDELSMPVKLDEFSDGEAALKSHLECYDIAFLDVEIGDVKGMEIAERIRSKNPHTLFFFITAYNHYLDDALNLQAFRFLTKPLDIKRLVNGLKKATEMLDKSVIEFMLKDGDTVRKVYSNDIIFVEIKGRLTEVVTQKEAFTSTNSIEFWQDKLSATSFYRVHKSYIINTNYITKYTRDDLVLDDRYIIPIAYRIRPAFRQFFLKRIEET